MRVLYDIASVKDERRESWCDGERVEEEEKSMEDSEVVLVVGESCYGEFVGGVGGLEGECVDR